MVRAPALQDPDEWPEELFECDGEVPYEQEDVFPGSVVDASPARRATGGEGTDARRARSVDRALRGGTGVHLQVLPERRIGKGIQAFG
jgi:hypothetical protein